MSEVSLRVLGPPQVLVDDRRAPISGRPLLIVIRLALAGANPVTAGRLRDDVWGDAASSDGALRVNLTRLRRAIGEGALERRQHGYVLRSAQLDATRFEDLLAGARDRSRTIEQRIAVYDEALDLWSGPAFEGLARPPWIDAEAVRLEELREHAVDERLELRSLVEEPGRIVPDLFTALEAAPLRERRAMLLATALYRTHRQADALAVIQQTCTSLRDQLGLDPGPPLRDLEHRILVHDPILLEPPLTVRSNVATDIEGRLRAVTALGRAGAYAEATAVLDGAEEEAHAVGERRSIARCRLTRATIDAMAGTGAADPLIDEALATARDLRDGPLLAQCALTRFTSGATADITSGLVELMEPLELLPATAPERVDLLCAAAVMVILVSHSEAPELLLSAAVEVHEAQGTARSGAVLAAARSIVGAARHDDPATVEAHAAESLRIAEEADDPTMVVVACQALLRARGIIGDLDGIDALVDPLRRAGHAAMIPFAVVRANLCRTVTALARGDLDRVPALLDETRALGERMGTINTSTALMGQRGVLLDERCELHTLIGELRDHAIEGRDHSHVFRAFHALVDPEVELRVDDARGVPHDAGFPPFLAVAAMVATARGDVALAGWCADELDTLGDTCITAGLATLMLGFAPHHAAATRSIGGDLDGAIERYERAISLASANGARLWLDHSRAGLARALATRSRPGDLGRAVTELEAIRAGPALARSERLARAVDAAEAAIDDSGADTPT